MSADTRIAEEARNETPYLHTGHTIRSWLFTTDHKRVAILYMLAITLFFFIGGVAATVIRLELFTPEADLVVRGTYNRMFTVHGAVMVWFFLIPAVPTVLGNFLLPLMIGCRDLAFPRLNIASWYVFIAGGLLALGSIVFGGIDTGWTFYTPYSTTFSNSAVTPMIAGIFIAGVSSVMTAVNFIVTTHTMRARGLGWFRLPLFVWSLYATSLVMLLATPVLGIALGLVAIERIWGVGIFDPSLRGDPLLFQHLFWFYSHPAVYIMILPGMGVVSEIIPCFARRRIFGYHFIAFSSLAIAVLGFLVWGHHMFVAGQSIYASTVFSLLSFLVAVPSAVKVFNWTFTLRKGWIHFTTPMLYALGFVWLFTVGGLTGLFVASIDIDLHVHDTYFVVAHFHYIMVGGMVMAYLGGIHFWWPKLTGRIYSERMGMLSAILLIIGFNVTFFPQFLLGYHGMPRRYASYNPEFQLLHVISTLGATGLALGYALPLFYLLWTLRRPVHSGPNPWRARGLEWRTSSPPPKHNFPTLPTVDEEPYAYHKPAPEDPRPHHEMELPRPEWEDPRQQPAAPEATEDEQP